MSVNNDNLLTVRQLTTKERVSLNRWLKNYNIPLNYRRSKKLCDAITVAKMFNKIKPGLADISSYSPCLSMPLNFLNWQLFNHLVLRKLDMAVSVRDMENLSHGCTKAVDFLLFTLKNNESRLEENDDDED